MNYTHIDTLVTNPTVDAKQERVTWRDILCRYTVIPVCLTKSILRRFEANEKERTVTEN